MLRHGLFLLGVALGASCVLPEVDLTGKACPCIAGYVCDEAANQCVAALPEGGNAATGGAGATGGSGATGADGGNGAGTTTTTTTAGGSGGGGGPPVVEDCFDGEDNDGDDLTDCEDDECVDACAVDCTDVPTLADFQKGTTAGASTTHTGTCVGFGPNAEVWYTYTASETGALALELTGPKDQGLYVWKDCNDSSTEYGCVDDASDDSTDYLAVPILAGETVTVFVDSFETTDIGPFQLTTDLDSMDEGEPNDDAGIADQADDGFDATLYPLGDVDWFKIAVPGPASTLFVETRPYSGDNCHFDSDIEIFAPDATTSLGYDDDGSGNGGCSELTLTNLAAGTYYLRVGSPQQVLGASTFVYEIGIDLP